MKFLFVCAVSAVFLAAGAADIDISSYGAGPMLKPAGTFYVSTSGNDANDGRSLEKAWRTIKRGVRDLRAGDTLLIKGGVYDEGGISLNYVGNKPHYTVQCGKPGSPIRVMGIPGEKVVIRGGTFFPAKGQGRVAKYSCKVPPMYGIVWEVPSQILLQKVDFPQIVEEYPGTYFYDDAKKEIMVHFVEKAPEGIRTAVERVGMRLRGSWLHLENVCFTNHPSGLSVRINAPVKENEVRNVTVKNCGFFNSAQNGTDIEGGHHGLFVGNFGRNNGERGTILVQPPAFDNLFTGNWCGPGPVTERHLKPYAYNYAFNFYSFKPGPRNHVIGNVMDDFFAFRWKSASPESIFRNNMVNGKFGVESPHVKVLVENNLIAGNLSWPGVSMNASDKDFEGFPMVFRNNVRKAAEFKNGDPMLAAAKKLAQPGRKYDMPPVTFADLKADHIGTTSAVVTCRTPECDGVITVFYRPKGDQKWLKAVCQWQGVSHAVGLTGLKPDTLYEYMVRFAGRRGDAGRAGTRKFRTPAVDRAPKTFEVGPGKMTLMEASCAVLPGDTVKLLPGRHTGFFAPMRGGLPGKPITLQGQGATIDGLNFYNPLVLLDDRSHIVVDNVRFARPEYESRKGVISAQRSSFITVRNCISIHKLYAGPFFRGAGHDFDLENNVSCGGDYALSFHGARNVRIHRNSVINSALFCVIFWGGSGNFSMTDNIYYRFSVPQKTNPAMFFIGVKGKVHSEGNVFWSPHKHQHIGGRFVTESRKVLKQSTTLEEWQRLTGMDKTSLHADPQFVDIAKGDFRLKPGSPAAGKGALVK